MRALYDFLFESDLPAALQVLWKLLTIGGSALLVYAAMSATSTEGTVVISVGAVLWGLIGLFTKLGDG